MLVCSCVSRPQQASVSEPSLRPGDCLSFRVDPFSSEPGSRRVIDSAGDIVLPDIGKLHVGGMTVEQVSQAITERYMPRMYNRVEVSRCPK
jgi:protein involved in polysaccharide export with SLBB domain